MTGFRPDIYADGTVNALQSSLEHGAVNLQAIPELVKLVIKEELWRHRFVVRLQEAVRFDRFADFVAEPPLKGLGTTVEMLRKFCQSAGDREAEDLIDQATANPEGRPETVNNVNGLERPQGNASARALRALRKNRPDLHAKVLAGEISPHGAMVEAGLRKKTLTVPRDAQGIAAAIKRHCTSEQVAEIVRLLHWSKEDPPSREEAEPAR